MGGLPGPRRHRARRGLLGRRRDDRRRRLPRAHRFTGRRGRRLQLRRPDGVETSIIDIEGEIDTLLVPGGFTWPDAMAELERGPIFVGDGRVFTSAGGTASIDLTLALVEADHGPALAREAAQFLVVFMQRSGGQDQLSVRLGMEPEVRPALRALLDGIAEDPAGDHRLVALSERSGFSERHLTRVFARELGTTPARCAPTRRWR